MLRTIALILAGLVLLLGLAAYGPGSLDAQRFDPPPPDPVLSGLFADPARPVTREASAFYGAEDLEVGADGRLYASLADGRIMVRDIDGGWSEFAHTGGRPLGLSFAPDGALFVADALKGLLRYGADNQLEVWLADESEGGPLVFTDDLSVLEDGSVILTDASRRWGYGEYMTSFLEGEQTGIVYRITAPGTYETLADGFAFINGVDHDPDTGLVYLNETWAGRLWVLDPDTGSVEVLVEGLPGYPDNLEFDPETGLIWIALPSERSAELEALHPRPFVKRLAWRWIQIAGLPELPPRPVKAMAFSQQGQPVRTLLGPDDAPTGITTVVPYRGQLWVSGLEREGIDAYAMPGDLP
jgi:sugar lactone lactonase YvrE